MAAPNTQQKRGLPKSFFLFLPGMPLEPARNGINPMDFIVLKLWSNLSKVI
jgi:hypothetical protein